MYFGKQKNVNSYYYDYDIGYQEEKTDYLTFILKILIVLLILVSFLVGFLFLSDKIQIVNDKESIFDKITQTKQPQQKEPSSDTLTQNDIANIISMVMKDIDKNKENTQTQKAQTNNSVSDNDYAQALLLEDVDNIKDNNINITNINTKKEVTKNKTTLSKKNHYNKIVINKSKNETYSNDSLSQLSTKIDNAIGETSQELSSSEYANEIKKEVAVRSNEMRVIVVQKGDTLSKIAKRAYGSYDAYMKIFEANPHIIKNPNEIYVGQRLRIPL